MEPSPMNVAVALIPLIVLVGLLMLVVMWVYRASKLREMKQRQILAMIEKGMVPPPELQTLVMDGMTPRVPRRTATAERFRTAGVIVVGLGVALALIIGVAGSQARVGLGIGGGIAALGVAMILNGLFATQGVPESEPRAELERPSGPAAPAAPDGP